MRINNYKPKIITPSKLCVPLLSKLSVCVCACVLNSKWICHWCSCERARATGVFKLPRDHRDDFLHLLQDKNKAPQKTKASK